MKVNIKELKKLAKEKKWEPRVLAEKLNVDYSYLTRILKGDRIGGAKVLSGMYALCKQEGLDVDQYIFLDKPLSVNKRKSHSA